VYKYVMFLSFLWLNQPIPDQTFSLLRFHYHTQSNTHTQTQQDYPARVITSSQSIVPTLPTTNTTQPCLQQYSNS